MAKLKKRADGRYVKRVPIGTDETGVPRYKWIYAQTAQELQDAVRSYLNRLDSGLDPQYDADSFGRLRQRWLEQRRLDGVGEAWLRNLQQYSGHLSVLDSLPAAEVRRSDIQDILNRLGQWHDGKPPLAYRTLCRIRRAAIDIFDSGIPEVLSYNPAIKCKAPRGSGEQTREAIEPEQQQWIREFPHRARRAAMLLMLSGLRRGEASALTWGDVDLSACTIRVDKSVDFVTGRLKEPKSAAGVRTVIIPHELAAFLAAEKAAEQPLCLYVIHQTNGKRMTNSAWHKLWESYLSALNAQYGHAGANRFASRTRNADGQPQGSLPMVIKTFTPHQLRHPNVKPKTKTFSTLFEIFQSRALRFCLGYFHHAAFIQKSFIFQTIST